MRKQFRVLTLLLFLAFCLMQIGLADNSSEVKLDSATHNAVLKFKSTKKSDGTSGTADVAGDFAKGLSTFKADLKFGPGTQKDLGDAKGALYWTMGEVLEAVAKFDMTVPKESSNKAPKKADLNIESVLSAADSYSKGNFSLTAPAPKKVPKVSVDGKLDGSAKSFGGGLNFNVELGDDAKQFPVKNLDLNISENEGSTTLKLRVAADPKSPIAPQITMMGKSPDQITGGIKGGLESLEVKVDKVEVSEFKDAPDVTATLTIVLKDWRGTVSKKLGESKAGAYENLDEAKMKAAVAKCLEAKFSNIDIKISNNGTAISGVTESKIENFNSFLDGYYDIVGMVMEQQMKDKAEGADVKQKMLMAYQATAMDQARKMMNVVTEANLTYKGEFKFKMETPVDKDGKVGDLAADGDFNIKMDNFKAYIEKAQAAGLPVGKSTALKVIGSLNEGTIHFTSYANTDAKLIEFYKGLLADTMKKAGLPDDQVKLVKDITVKGGATSIDVTKDGVVGSGYLESSDLTPAIKSVVALADPNFSGDPSGYQVSLATDKDQATIEGQVFFNKLMVGKSNDDIKKALNAPVVDAKADDVKLIAIEKPEVKVPSELASVQADGKKLLGGGSIASALTGGGTTGGIPTGLLALGGLVAVGVVGVGVMAGGKKS